MSASSRSAGKREFANSERKFDGGNTDFNFTLVDKLQSLLSGRPDDSTGEHFYSQSSFVESALKSRNYTLIQPDHSYQKNRSGFFMNDIGYLLARCLAEVVEHMPEDPIEYIAHWLYKIADAETYFHEKLIFDKECLLVALDHQRRHASRLDILFQVNKKMKVIMNELAKSRATVNELVVNQLKGAVMESENHHIRNRHNRREIARIQKMLHHTEAQMDVTTKKATMFYLMNAIREDDSTNQAFSIFNSEFQFSEISNFSKQKEPGYMPTDHDKSLVLSEPPIFKTHQDNDKYSRIQTPLDPQLEKENGQNIDVVTTSPGRSAIHTPSLPKQMRSQVFENIEVIKDNLGGRNYLDSTSAKETDTSHDATLTISNLTDWEEYTIDVPGNRERVKEQIENIDYLIESTSHEIFVKYLDLNTDRRRRAGIDDFLEGIGMLNDLDKSIIDRSGRIRLPSSYEIDQHFYPLLWEKGDDYDDAIITNEIHAKEKEMQEIEARLEEIKTRLEETRTGHHEHKTLKRDQDRLERVLTTLRKQLATLKYEKNKPVMREIESEIIKLETNLRQIDLLASRPDATPEELAILEQQKIDLRKKMLAYIKQLDYFVLEHIAPMLEEQEQEIQKIVQRIQKIDQLLQFQGPEMNKTEQNILKSEKSILEKKLAAFQKGLDRLLMQQNYAMMEGGNGKEIHKIESQLDQIKNLLSHKPLIPKEENPTLEDKLPAYSKRQALRRERQEKRAMEKEMIEKRIEEIDKVSLLPEKNYEEASSLSSERSSLKRKLISYKKESETTLRREMIKEKEEEMKKVEAIIDEINTLAQDPELTNERKEALSAEKSKMEKKLVEYDDQVETLRLEQTRQMMGQLDDKIQEIEKRIDGIKRMTQVTMSTEEQIALHNEKSELYKQLISNRKIMNSLLRKNSKPMIKEKEKEIQEIRERLEEIHRLANLSETSSEEQAQLMSEKSRLLKKMFETRKMCTNFRLENNKSKIKEKEYEFLDIESQLEELDTSVRLSGISLEQRNSLMMERYSLQKREISVEKELERLHSENSKLMIHATESEIQDLVSRLAEIERSIQSPELSPKQQHELKSERLILGKKLQVDQKHLEILHTIIDLEEELPMIWTKLEEIDNLVYNPETFPSIKNQELLMSNRSEILQKMTDKRKQLQTLRLINEKYQEIKKNEAQFDEIEELMLNPEIILSLEEKTTLRAKRSAIEKQLVADRKQLENLHKMNEKEKEIQVIQTKLDEIDIKRPPSGMGSDDWKELLFATKTGLEKRLYDQRKPLEAFRSENYIFMIEDKKRQLQKVVSRLHEIDRLTRHPGLIKEDLDKLMFERIFLEKKLAVYDKQHEDLCWEHSKSMMEEKEKDIAKIEKQLSEINRSALCLNLDTEGQKRLQSEKSKLEQNLISHRNQLEIVFMESFKRLIDEEERNLLKLESRVLEIDKKTGLPQTSNKNLLQLEKISLEKQMTTCSEELFNLHFKHNKLMVQKKEKEILMIKSQLNDIDRLKHQHETSIDEIKTLHSETKALEGKLYAYLKQLENLRMELNKSMIYKKEKEILKLETRLKEIEKELATVSRGSYTLNALDGEKSHIWRSRTAFLNQLETLHKIEKKGDEIQKNEERIAEIDRFCLLPQSTLKEQYPLKTERSGLETKNRLFRKHLEFFHQMMETEKSIQNIEDRIHEIETLPTLYEICKEEENNLKNETFSLESKLAVYNKLLETLHKIEGQQREIQNQELASNHEQLAFLLEKQGKQMDLLDMMARLFELESLTQTSEISPILQTKLEEERVTLRKKIDAGRELLSLLEQIDDKEKETQLMISRLDQIGILLKENSEDQELIIEKARLDIKLKASHTSLENMRLKYKKAVNKEKRNEIQRIELRIQQINKLFIILPQMPIDDEQSLKKERSFLENRLSAYDRLQKTISEKNKKEMETYVHQAQLDENERLTQMPKMRSFEEETKLKSKKIEIEKKLDSNHKQLEVLHKIEEKETEKTKIESRLEEIDTLACLQPISPDERDKLEREKAILGGKKYSCRKSLGTLNYEYRKLMIDEKEQMIKEIDSRFQGLMHGLIKPEENSDLKREMHDLEKQSTAYHEQINNLRRENINYMIDEKELEIDILDKQLEEINRLIEQPGNSPIKQKILISRRFSLERSIVPQRKTLKLLYWEQSKYMIEEKQLGIKEIQSRLVHIDSLLCDPETTNDEQTRLRTERSNMEKKLGIYSKLLDDLHRENITDMIEEKSKEIEQMESRINEIHILLKHPNENVGELEMEQSVLEIQLDTCHTELKNLNVESRKITIDKKEKEIICIESRLDDIARSVNEPTITIEEQHQLIMEKDSLDKKLVAFRKEFESLNWQHNKTLMEDKENEIHMLKKRLSEICITPGHSRMNFDEEHKLRHERSTLEKKLTVCYNQLESMRRENLKAMIDEKVIEINVMTSRLGEIDVILAKPKTHTQQQEKLNTERTSIENKLKNNQQQLQNLHKEHRQYTMESNEKEIKLLRSRLEEIQRLIPYKTNAEEQEVLKTERFKLQQKLSYLETSNQQIKKQLIDDKEKEIQDIYNRVDEIKYLVRLPETTKEHRMSLNSEKIKLDKKLGDYRKQLETLRLEGSIGLQVPQHEDKKKKSQGIVVPESLYRHYSTSIQNEQNQVNTSIKEKSQILKGVLDLTELLSDGDISAEESDVKVVDPRLKEKRRLKDLFKSKADVVAKCFKNLSKWNELLEQHREAISSVGLQMDKAETYLKGLHEKKMFLQVRLQEKKGRLEHFMAHHAEKSAYIADLRKDLFTSHNNLIEAEVSLKRAINNRMDILLKQELFKQCQTMEVLGKEIERISALKYDIRTDVSVPLINEQLQKLEDRFLTLKRDKEVTKGLLNLNDDADIHELIKDLDQEKIDELLNVATKEVHLGGIQLRDHSKQMETIEKEISRVVNGYTKVADEYKSTKEQLLELQVLIDEQWNYLRAKKKLLWVLKKAFKVKFETKEKAKELSKNAKWEYAKLKLILEKKKIDTRVDPKTQTLIDEKLSLSTASADSGRYRRSTHDKDEMLSRYGTSENVVLSKSEEVLTTETNLKDVDNIEQIIRNYGTYSKRDYSIQIMKFKTSFEGAPDDLKEDDFDRLREWGGGYIVGHGSPITIRSLIDLQNKDGQRSIFYDSAEEQSSGEENDDQPEFDETGPHSPSRTLDSNQTTLDEMKGRLKKKYFKSLDSISRRRSVKDKYTFDGYESHGVRSDRKEQNYSDGDENHKSSSESRKNRFKENIDGAWTEYEQQNTSDSDEMFGIESQNGRLKEQSEFDKAGIKYDKKKRIASQKTKEKFKKRSSSQSQKDSSVSIANDEQKFDYLDSDEIFGIESQNGILKEQSQFKKDDREYDKKGRIKSNRTKKRFKAQYGFDEDPVSSSKSPKSRFKENIDGDEKEYEEQNYSDSDETFGSESQNRKLKEPSEFDDTGIEYEKKKRIKSQRIKKRFKAQDGFDEDPVSSSKSSKNRFKEDIDGDEKEYDEQNYSDSDETFGSESQNERLKEQSDFDDTGIDYDKKKIINSQRIKKRFKTQDGLDEDQVSSSKSPKSRFKENIAGDWIEYEEQNYSDSDETGVEYDKKKKIRSHYRMKNRLQEQSDFDEDQKSRRKSQTIKVNKLGLVSSNAALDDEDITAENTEISGHSSKSSKRKSFEVKGRGSITRSRKGLEEEFYLYGEDLSDELFEDASNIDIMESQIRENQETKDLAGYAYYYVDDEAEQGLQTDLIDDGKQTRKEPSKIRHFKPTRRESVSRIQSGHDFYTDEEQTNKRKSKKYSKKYSGHTSKSTLNGDEYEEVVCNWNRTKSLRLVCIHPILGVLRTRPEKLHHAEMPRKWENYDEHVFYHGEIYTFVRSDGINDTNITDNDMAYKDTFTTPIPSPGPAIARNARTSLYPEQVIARNARTSLYPDNTASEVARSSSEKSTHKPKKKKKHSGKFM